MRCKHALPVHVFLYLWRSLVFLWILSGLAVAGASEDPAVEPSHSAVTRPQDAAPPRPRPQSPHSLPDVGAP